MDTEFTLIFRDLSGAESDIMSRDHSSVEALKRESERSRAALTHTVAELREKVGETTAELKTRVSPSYLAETVKRQARANPLQTVAVGAALAYPLWGLLRVIPAPIMLVGAGLWLASKGGRRALEQATATAGEVVEKATAEASDFAAEAQAAATQGIKRITDPIADAGATLSSGVSSMASKATAAAHDVRDSIAGAGRSLVESVTDTAANVSESGLRTVSAVRTRAGAVGNQSRNGFVDLVDRNPLLVAGVGLAVGAFIAASLPPSNTENRIFGERSDNVKDKARELASQGVERAKEVATNVVSDVASAAAREGLTAEGVKKAADGLTASVKAVADRGMQAALGDEVSPPSKVSSQSYKG